MLSFSLCYGLPGKHVFLQFIHTHFYKALTDLQDWVDVFFFSAPYIEYYRTAYYILLHLSFFPAFVSINLNEGWNSVLLHFVFLVQFLTQIGRQ